VTHQNWLAAVVVVVLTFADDVEADAFAKVFSGNLR